MSRFRLASRWLSVGARGRNILHTGAWSFFAKAAATANLFLCVPFVLSALGPEEFGAWATLVSVVAFAGFLDFGFGNSTMNLVAAAHGRGQADEVKTLVREGQRTLAQVAIALAALMMLLLVCVPWHRVLGLHPDMTENARWASATVLFAIVLAVPLNLATRIQLGLGRGDHAFRWQAVGQLSALCLVIILALANASLPALTAAAVLAPLLGSLGNTISLFRDPAMTGAAARRPELARAIRNEGALFFVLQLAAALAFSADLPLISSLCGSVAAGEYSIIQRVFSVVPLTLSLLWTPLWPTYRHALASGHHEWVTRTLRRSVVAAVCFAAGMGSIIFVGFDQITGLWLKREIGVGSTLLAGFAIWVVLEAGGTALATFLNAASVVRYQVVIAIVFATTCLAGKALVLAHIGMSAIPWVTAATYATISLIPTFILRRRLLDAALAKHN